MWTAIVYVWPKTPILQLRACLCVLLLAVMRLLNLAVPILYRNMVNILSDAAIAASSGSPTGWQPTFWNVSPSLSTPHALPWHLQSLLGSSSQSSIILRLRRCQVSPGAHAQPECGLPVPLPGTATSEV